MFSLGLTALALSSAYALDTGVVNASATTGIQFSREITEVNDAKVLLTVDTGCASKDDYGEQPFR